MGNTMRRLCGEFLLEPEQSNGNSGNAHEYQPPSAPHGVSTETAGHAALARDLLQFEVTGQVFSLLFPCHFSIHDYLAPFPFNAVNRNALFVVVAAVVDFFPHPPYM